MLSSWKDIARHLGKSVRTVQRWEISLGLPVRRPNSHDRNIVVAVPAELDAWVVQRLQSRKASVRVHCSDQLDRMQSLVSKMTRETQRTLRRTAELIEKLERNRIRRIDLLSLTADAPAKIGEKRAAN